MGTREIRAMSAFTFVLVLAATSFGVPAARAQEDESIDPSSAIGEDAGDPSGDEGDEGEDEQGRGDAGEGEDDYDGGEPDVDAELQKARARAQHKAEQADAGFDAMMQQQNAPPSAQEPAATSDNRGSLEMSRAGGEEEEGLAQVEVDLPEFVRVRDRLRALREAEAKPLGPAVTLGAAVYSGRAREGALELRLELQVTLGHPDRWKVVPLVGDDVVLVRAAAGGQDLPVSRQNGYHVWVTRRTGEVSLAIDFLVPAHGPRGSIEYDFVVSRTPVTRFACRFPVPGLEPRLDAAVRTTVRTVGSTTELAATLAPTTRIHLVGFRDLGEVEGRTAKVYAESTNLLSVGETAVELFSVVRYTILYGGTKSFDIALPPGTSIVSADGKGAFRFALDETAAGTVLRGETAYPIRDNFEISLRLERELGAGTSAFDAPLPRCLAVEREHGWLGVEVTGKLGLEEQARDNALAVDVRQLPAEMIAGAVSPILKAYRYHDPRARVRLAATRLPEKEPTSASIDRVRAFSVVSADGQVLTDLRLTLRNRQRHGLGLVLPEGAEVRSTLLDGEPVKPSRNDAGELLLPLKRSAGDRTLEPFTVQVVLAGRKGALGWLGRETLALPAADLPVSSLAWSIYLPAKNVYSRLTGDIEPQTLVGAGSWHQASPRAYVASVLGAAGAHPAAGPSTADTGAMPVRIKLPANGIRLEYERYWIGGGKPVQVSVWYLRGWLRFPLALGLGALVVVGLLLFSRRWPVQKPERARPWLGALLVAVSLWPLGKVAGGFGVAVALLVAAAVVLARRSPGGNVAARVRAWAAALPARFRAREKVRWSFGLALWKLALAGGFVVLGVVLLVTIVRVLVLLFSPLPG